MRTYDEIYADIRRAIRFSDVRALHTLAAEMQMLDTPMAHASAGNALGAAASIMSDYPSALEHFNQALVIFESLGKRENVIIVAGNLGVAYEGMGDHAMALEYHRRAMKMSEELDDREGVAFSIGHIGSVYFRTGSYPLALEHHMRALAIHQELGDRISEARVTANIGNVYMITGDFPSAMEYYGRALAMAEEAGNRFVTANGICSIANVYNRSGESTRALEYYERALAVFEELEDRSGIAQVLGNTAGVYFSTGNHEAALAHLYRVLALHEEMDDRTNASRFTGNTVSVLMEMGRYDEAAMFLERQATMLMDDPVIWAQYTANRGKLAESRGDLDAAHGHLQDALRIATESGLRAESSIYHRMLRDLAQKRNDFAGFIEHNAEYLRITEEIRGREATQRLAMMEAERKMEGERREREKERAVLFSTLPKHVADRVVRGDDVSGDHFDHAAVMFLDIVGFTSNTSTMPPADVVKLLEHIFSTIDGICDTHNVVKIKTIGDSYMCFRGDADATTNAQSIARVGIAVMQGAFTWPDGEKIQFRGGMHIGTATAGVIGTQRLQYDVWGDTVNVASRMESTSEPGRIHVSEAFADALRTSSDPAPYTLIQRGEVEIKGKGTMNTYWLESA